jgi:hypothetical protein
MIIADGLEKMKNISQNMPDCSLPLPLAANRNPP